MPTSFLPAALRPMDAGPQLLTARGIASAVLTTFIRCEPAERECSSCCRR